MDFIKEFISKLQNLDRSKNIATVFKDFLTLCTCSLSQPFYKSPDIEQLYKDTIKQYSKEQAVEFSKLLALLVEALEENFQDFLGQVYMKLNIGNHAIGQLFTPYCVSKMMSEINFVSAQKFVNNGVIKLSEPCCGSGGMIIAFAETMKQYNYNYQKMLYVEAIDIDENAFMMCYIQLSLLGIPAKVIQGDTLTLKFKRVLFTPFYFINGFSWRLKEYKQAEIKSEQEIIKEVVEIKQLTLF